MPDDFVNLQHQVNGHDGDLSRQAVDLKKLTDRVTVLETDMLTVIAMFQKLRIFAHVHPGLERQAEEFDILLNTLRERYKIPPAAKPA
jgi:hypothetical protein